jgi:acyl-CoA synthetase (AMP-forming)/AMP-acid ligase II
MFYRNLGDILNDSFSPALILTTPLPSQIFYPSVRRAISRLSAQEPFTSLVPGDAVSFLLPNGLELVICFFTIVGLRGTANPLNPAYKKSELLFYLGDVRPKAVLVLEGAPNVSETLEAAQELGIPCYAISLHHEGSLVPKKKPSLLRKSRSLFQWPAALASSSSASSKSLTALPVLEPTLTSRSLDPSRQSILSHATLSKEHALGKKSPDDIALFLHTSGTTGRPKLVPLSHRNILTSLHNIQTSYHLSASDATYLVMPLFHVHGLIGGLLSTLFSGGTVILPPKFSVTTFWDDFVAYRVFSFYFSRRTFLNQET